MLNMRQHNDSFKSSADSFKRMLGGGTCSANLLNNAYLALHSAL